MQTVAEREDNVCRGAKLAIWLRHLARSVDLSRKTWNQRVVPTTAHAPTLEPLSVSTEGKQVLSLERLGKSSATSFRYTGA